MPYASVSWGIMLKSLLHANTKPSRCEILTLRAGSSGSLHEIVEHDQCTFGDLLHHNATQPSHENIVSKGPICQV